MCWELSYNYVVALGSRRRALIHAFQQRDPTRDTLQKGAHDNPLQPCFCLLMKGRLLLASDVMPGSRGRKVNVCWFQGEHHRDVCMILNPIVLVDVWISQWEYKRLG